MVGHNFNSIDPQLLSATNFASAESPVRSTITDDVCCGQTPAPCTALLISLGLGTMQHNANFSAHSPAVQRRYRLANFRCMQRCRHLEQGRGGGGDRN